MIFQTGLELLLNNSKLQARLKNKRVALLAHPASVCQNLTHALDALKQKNINIVAAFGPQHGIQGEKQDNMVESQDFIHPQYHIPIFSLYGENGRHLTAQMLQSFDVLLIDLQDLGCRIYTFLTTMCYVLQDCAQHQKSVWILDRPNPAGRRIEGLTLEKGFESFVGIDAIPMRYGLTLAEMADFYIKRHRLQIDFNLLLMKNYAPNNAPLFGWVSRPWINPSPNAASLNMARLYAGTVLLEGTNLSEGRGTTRPLECMGAPALDLKAILKRMETINPNVFHGILVRECFFEPTFHKHAGQLCTGLFLHTDFDHFQIDAFSPFRFVATFLKAVFQTHQELPLWRKFVYEYEREKLPIDIINGSCFLREWVENPSATFDDLHQKLIQDENAWQETQRQFLLYA